MCTVRCSACSYTASGDAPAADRFKFIFDKNQRFADTFVIPDKLPPWLTEADLAFFTNEFKQSGFRWMPRNSIAGSGQERVQVGCSVFCRLFWVVTSPNTWPARARPGQARPGRPGQFGVEELTIEQLKLDQ